MNRRDYLSQKFTIKEEMVTSLNDDKLERDGFTLHTKFRHKGCITRIQVYDNLYHDGLFLK